METPQPNQVPSAGTPSNITLQDGTQLDPKVVKVMQAIRKVESNSDFNAIGDNGTSAGAYQWNNDGKKLAPGEIPINFQNQAKSVGLNSDDFSPANQNKVWYTWAKQLKDAGHSPDEIAAFQNGAKKDPTTGQYTYVNPEYGQKFRDALVSNQGQSQGQNQGQAVSNTVPNNGLGAFNQTVQPTQTQQNSVNQDVTASTDTEKKPGLLSRIGHGALNVFKDIESPFLGLAAIPTQLLAKATGQQDPFANGAFGGVQATSLDGGVGKAIEKKVGDAAQVGSYLIPGEGLLGAAGMGALQGAGSQLSQGQGATNVALGGVEGAGIGAATAGLTGLAGKAISKTGDLLTGESTNKAVQGIKDAYSKALNLNASERGFESRSGKDLAEVLMKNEAPLGKYENGTLDASGAIEKLQNTLTPLNDQAQKILSNPQGVVKNISLEDVLSGIKSKISNSKVTAAEEQDMVSEAEKLIKAEVNKYGTDVPPDVADRIKQGFQNSVFKKAITPEGTLRNNVQYLISDELKSATENSIAGTDAEESLKELNAKRSDLIDATKRLTKLDGVRILKGGKLGNMFGGLTGTIAGGVSGGTLGALAGDYFGTKASEFLNDPATRIAIAKGKAQVTGVLPKVLGDASEPIGQGLLKAGNAVKKSSRAIGLLANTLTKNSR